MGATLHQLLKTLVERGGSDLHITTNSPPMIRVDGDLVPLDYPPLSVPETKQLAYSILADVQKHRFEEQPERRLSCAGPPFRRSSGRSRTRFSASASWASRTWSRVSATRSAASSSSSARRARAD